MLFGNSSLHEDVTLADVVLPRELAQAFGGPRHGLDGLRRRAGAPARALTCSALKPQGLPPAKLAELAGRFARGGIDYIKDDHGLADQAYSPFAAQLAAALRGVARPGGRTARTRAEPQSGDLDGMRAQIAAARRRRRYRHGRADDRGPSSFHRLVRRHPTVAFIAHPTMAGAARIAPALLLGRCSACSGPMPSCSRTLWRTLRLLPRYLPGAGARGVDDRDGLRPCVPVPAGGDRRSRAGNVISTEPT
jgi:ribulose-bisphosphate carboxylase large chain